MGQELEINGTRTLRALRKKTKGPKKRANFIGRSDEDLSGKMQLQAVSPRDTEGIVRESLLRLIAKVDLLLRLNTDEDIVYIVATTGLADEITFEIAENFSWTTLGFGALPAVSRTKKALSQHSFLS